ncbi:hypothetical protein CH330_02605 [candidate division WOR-3 bacterium JGI_Cruoil_03_51_56]|uniref:FlgD/Vpr Ig-like domain-containing protein n=1 Tax=candidate division WOR-3 bacterium JGI_Cruoil_03_51_56 TaxID=1973747 RepID=A0A235BWJ5_UNCW3|nr:MAG: hypothetical protein CH330_02605 [candidate division WOR-3 bacterium JGI_Cruoil_03_51_56]
MALVKRLDKYCVPETPFRRPKCCTSLLNPRDRSEISIVSPKLPGVIYDASGRMVRGFVLQTDREWVWDGTNQKGMPVPQGVYTIVVDGVPINRTKVVKLK